MENELFVISSELKWMEVYSRIFEMNLLFVILNFILILDSFYDSSCYSFVCNFCILKKFLL